MSISVERSERSSLHKRGIAPGRLFGNDSLAVNVSRRRIAIGRPLEDFSAGHLNIGHLICHLLRIDGVENEKAEKTAHFSIDVQHFPSASNLPRCSCSGTKLGQPRCCASCLTAFLVGSQALGTCIGTSAYSRETLQSPLDSSPPREANPQV